MATAGRCAGQKWRSSVPPGLASLAENHDGVGDALSRSTDPQFNVAADLKSRVIYGIKIYTFRLRVKTVSGTMRTVSPRRLAGGTGGIGDA